MKIQVMSAAAVVMLGIAGCGKTTPVRSAETPALVEYVQQVEREWPGESEQQALTVDSLRLLANAIESVATRRQMAWPELAVRIERLRDDIEEYRLGTPGTLEQTTRLRTTFASAADLIDELVERAGFEKRPVDPRLSAMRRAADSLGPDMLLRRQPDTIERFFHHAGEALRRVDRG